MEKSSPYSKGGVHREVQQNVDYNIFTLSVYIYNPILSKNLHLQRIAKSAIYNQKYYKSTINEIFNFEQFWDF